MNWETRLTDSLRLRISPNLFYSDEYIAGGSTRETFDPVTNPLGDIVQDSYTTIDLSVSLISTADNWSVSLIAKNLTDEQIITGAGPAPFRPPSGDDQQVNIRRGRQVFIEAGYNF